MTEYEPFPIRHMSLSTISRALNMEIHESAIELPRVLSKIQKSCGVVMVSADGQNRTQKLIDDVNRLMIDHKSAVVMYPEGGTSGKRNEGGPYDLDIFHKGAFVVAKNLNIPILPVTQFFNSKSGFEIDVLEPIQADAITYNGINQIIMNTQDMMQQTLNSKV